MITTYTKTVAGRKSWDGTTGPDRTIDMIRATITGTTTTASKFGNPVLTGYTLEDGRIADASAALTGIPADWTAVIPTNNAASILASRPEAVAALIAAGACVEVPAAKVRAA